jgi:protocatechuate 3,4-dioxygenase beta subunit
MLHDKTKLTRRDFVRSWLAAPAASALALPVDLAQAANHQLPATRSCGNGVRATRRQTEGPYFTPDTPLRRNFRKTGGPGEPMVLLGLVTDRACRPMARALIELWHCDTVGNYDNRGFKLRGHQFTDARGRFVFETIVPGLYPGRTRHFHVKVQPPGRRVLTTQLYFPGEPGNRRDGIYHPSLVMKMSSAKDGKVGRFDFVVG